ncbi:MAG: ABC transporter substrate-binding protein, partial [Chloroflexota bacterium]
PPFDNLKLRQAVNLALDRERVGLVAWGNVSVHPQLLVYTKDSPWSRSDDEIWNVVPGWGTGAKKAQEIEQAKQLVKDAGYPNGLDTELMVRSNLYEDANQEVQKEILPIGIRTAIKIVDAATLQDRMAALNYAMQYYTFTVTTRDPDEVVGQYWITGGSRNWKGYSNPGVDKLYIQQSSELDPVKRKQLFRQIEDIVVLKDIGYAPTMVQEGSVFWWKRLQGVTVGPNPYAPPGLFRADRLWIEE